MAYPEWSYFPRNQRPPGWTPTVIEIIAAAENSISTEKDKGPNSDAVLAAIAPGLVGFGFRVESSKARANKIRRPVLYGPNGKEAVSYEIDAFHDELGIAVEVEAGRGALNNADYRDIIRASLILDADYLVILMPQHYRTKDSQVGGVQAYRSTERLLDALYASQRLRPPFIGVLAISY
jgi:hypothetical protein